MEWGSFFFFFSEAPSRLRRYILLVGYTSPKSRFGANRKRNPMNTPSLYLYGLGDILKKKD